jgi:hypothetical protein
MKQLLRPTAIVGAMLVAVAMLLPATPALADDPPPINPTLTPPGGGGIPTPFIATPEQWAWAVSQILAIYPDADYLEVCFFALSWYNMLPPAPPPPSGSLPPP